MGKNIAVVGAGMTGLTAAYELSKITGYNVSVFEADKKVGGLSAVTDINGVPVENIYHHIFTSDTYLIRLAEELQAGGIVWKEPSDAFYTGGKHYPFTSPLDLLRFKPIPFIYRVTMGLLVLRARFIREIPENETAGEWISRLAGKPVYEKVWKPLMEAKFDKDAGEISASWIWNKFKLRGSTRGKNIS
jgi:protoporphyrinogen oxidase